MSPIPNLKNLKKKHFSVASSTYSRNNMKFPKRIRDEVRFEIARRFLIIWVFGEVGIRYEAKAPWLAER